MLRTKSGRADQSKATTPLTCAEAGLVPLVMAKLVSLGVGTGTNVHAGSGEIGLDKTWIVGARAAAAETSEDIIDVIRADGKRSVVDRRRVSHGRTSGTATPRAGHDENSGRLRVVDDHLQLRARRKNRYSRCNAHALLSTCGRRDGLGLFPFRSVGAIMN